MNKGVLGIDLGTSSVKVLLICGDRKTKIREKYIGNGTDAWTAAIRKAVSQLDTSLISAIGLSSQVGTYIIDNKHIISWNDSVGGEELAEIKSKFSQQKFVDEISMPHPSLVSYPIPRILYAKKTFGDFGQICQPKDYICELLTGNRVTDMYSWRGLANLETAEYSRFFTDFLKISKEQLPAMHRPEDLAGRTIEANILGLPGGIPVYIGCNDFFASLLGMGIRTCNQMFDITGTSEHIGIISDSIDIDTQVVSGPYFTDNVSYGVTASSGASMDFCLDNFDTDISISDCPKGNPPIFLPYLNGERAPIWDSNAKGMFFGINTGCTSKHLAYSVMEGIAFSLWHIYGCLPKTRPTGITVSGGGAKSDTLNQLKAELFNIPVITLEENDTSALGAAMLASVGCGIYKNINTAADNMCKVKKTYHPTGDIREALLGRFETYVKLYPAVKNIL